MLLTTEQPAGRAVVYLEIYTVRNTLDMFYCISLVESDVVGISWWNLRTRWAEQDRIGDLRCEMQCNNISDRTRRVWCSHRLHFVVVLATCREASMEDDGLFI